MTFKHGDMVVCIEQDRAALTANDLIYGEIYEVVRGSGVDCFGAPYNTIRVLASDGTERMAFPSRFVLADTWARTPTEPESVSPANELAERIAAFKAVTEPLIQDAKDAALGAEKLAKLYEQLADALECSVYWGGFFADAVQKVARLKAEIASIVDEDE